MSHWLTSPRPHQEFRDVIADLLRDLRTLTAQMKNTQGHVTIGREANGKPIHPRRDTDKPEHPYEAPKSTAEPYRAYDDNFSMGPHFIPTPTPSRGFPVRMITDYQPRYAGWRIQKGPSAANLRPKPATQSWRSPVVTQLFLSSEELYLETRFLDARHVRSSGSSKRSFLQDVLDKLPSENKRFAVTELIRKQNWLLQNWESDLEWRLAGLRVRTRAVSRYKRETEHITVILKTELRIPPPTGWPPPYRVPLGSANPGIVRPPEQASQGPGRFPATLAASPAQQRQPYSRPLPNDRHPTYVSGGRRQGYPSQSLPQQQNYSHGPENVVPSIPAGDPTSNPRPSSISERMTKNQTKREDKRKAVLSPFVVEFQHPKQNWRVRVREYERSGSREQEMMAAEEDQIIDEMMSEWQDAMLPTNS